MQKYYNRRSEEGIKIVDKSVVEEIQGGNLGRFEEIVDQYQDYIYSLCLGIVQDPYMAGDITQEVFIKIYTSIGDYRNEGFKTWISRIATNRCIDYIRKRAKEQEKIVSLNLYKEPITIPDTPESLLLEKDQREKLLSICEGLGSRYRGVVKKYYVENKSYAVIAQEENISIRAVESRLYRAKRMIKKRWEEEGYGRFS